MIDESFSALGTVVRVITADPGAAAAARAEILAYQARLSRFDPASELCALNADPRPAVPASALLREAVAAALWAAEHTRGLVDPCLLEALEGLGYRRSFVVPAPADRLDPRASDPSPRPATPDPRGRWRAVRVEAGSIARPPGLRLDLGGVGKGHVADRVAGLLRPHGPFVIDCGGDLRVGGRRAVQVAHPLEDRVTATFELVDAAIATSSVVARSWRRADGSSAHHLVDPGTGEPARTGLLSVTALAPTTLEAEVLAKAALLAGHRAARRALRRAGGVLVHDDGTAEILAPSRLAAAA